MPIGPFEKKIEAMVRMTKRQSIALNLRAEELKCTSAGGKQVGQPSWRVMLLGIADGTLRAINPSDRSQRKAKKSPRKDKEKGVAIVGAPAWWRPFYGNAMGADWAIKASGLNRDELVAMGLRLEINPRLTHPEILVGSPEWAPTFTAAPKRPHWWWQPDEDSAMWTSVAVASSGWSLDQLIAGGLVPSGDGEWLSAPEIWTAWQWGKSDQTKTDS